VVLGAGGAARAVVHALASRGAGEILLVNRSVERAAELARGAGPRVRALAATEVARALAGAALLVNTTSLGMVGEPPLDLDLAGLPRAALVADLVYVPLETELLRRAGARGNRVVDGLGMLLHQAVPGFERWFGIRPSVTPALRDLVIADIAGKAQPSATLP
jgi:shikimate dehydrogenase